PGPAGSWPCSRGDELLHVLGDHVGLQVDSGPRLLAAERGAGQGFRDQADLEPGRARALAAAGFRLAGRRYGQADAVHGDRALLDDVPEDLISRGDPDDFPVRVRGPRGDRAGPVDV